MCLPLGEVTLAEYEPSLPGPVPAKAAARSDSRTDRLGVVEELLGQRKIIECHAAEVRGQRVVWGIGVHCQTRRGNRQPLSEAPAFGKDQIAEELRAALAHSRFHA